MVKLDIFIGVIDSDKVLIDQGCLALWRKFGEGNTEWPVATAKVEAAIIVIDLDILQ